MNLLLPIVACIAPAALAGPGIPARTPNACADLRTPAGVQTVRGEWRYHDAAFVAVDHRAPGPDLKPTGAPLKTHDLSPKAGAAAFDDSDWPILDPASMESRRTTGRLAMGWYRLRFTIPEALGGFSTAGSTVVLELSVDDYAEVWVDGQLPHMLGQAGGPMIAGWNTPNRVIVAQGARPGQQVTVAVLAMNGPISDPPGNYVWVRSATLDFYTPERLGGSTPAPIEIVRLDPALDAIIPPEAKLEKLADGFTFTEGPVWVPARIAGAGASPINAGYLLFSDPNENVIYRWSPPVLGGAVPGSNVTIYRTKSGYSGFDLGRYRQAGSNGLTLDREGRLVICEHGNRRVTRLEKNGTITVLADRFNGKRLNSPNDVTMRSDGTLFFTDPPFGLPGFHDDPAREQPHCGVYALYNGQLKLVSTDMTGPNGIALSPDERTLYVGNWDEKKKVVFAYDSQPDGSLTRGRVFFDLTSAPGDEAIDGVKTDAIGNVYISGPVGVWIVSPSGKAIGTLKLPELAANFAFGDQDGRTLYLAARSGLYRLRMNVAGARSGM